MAGLPFCSLFNLFNCRLILTNLSFVFVLLSLNFQNWFWWAHLRINRVKRSQEFRLIRFIKSLYALIPIPIFSFLMKTREHFMLTGKAAIFFF